VIAVGAQLPLELEELLELELLLEELLLEELELLDEELEELLEELLVVVEPLEPTQLGTIKLPS
jgi:hypothetical protein